LNARATCAWLALLTPVLFAACEGGDVAVFSDANAGATASAGMGGDGAGSGGSLVGIGGAQAGAAQLDPAQAGAGDEAGAAPMDMPCHRSEECPVNHFCAKIGCEEALGSCQEQPVICLADASPVCGCNHVTYWNDCFRRQHGIAAATPGECGAGAKACTSNAECDRGTCSHLLLPPATCDTPPGPGVCWVTPPDCGGTSDPRGWLQCPPPQMASGGSGACASTCEALHDGHPFVALDGGASCP
jgi:Kazal-type serine protease inhibitor domain